MHIDVIGPGHNFRKPSAKYVDVSDKDDKHKDFKLMLEKGRLYSGKDVADSCILVQPQLLNKRGKYQNRKDFSFLIDAGNEAITEYFKQLSYGDIDPAKILLLSHNHRDHSGGLLALLNDNPQKEETGIVLYGPRGEEEDPMHTETQGTYNIVNFVLRAANEVGNEDNIIGVNEVSDEDLVKYSNMARDNASYKEGLKSKKPLLKNGAEGYVLLHENGLKVETAFGKRHSTSKEWVLAYSIYERALNLEYPSSITDQVKKEAINNIQNALRSDVNSIYSREDLRQIVNQLFESKAKMKRSLNFQENTTEFLRDIWNKLLEESHLLEIENKVTYITDTLSNKRLVNLAQGSDVLVCGTPNLEANGSDHLSIEDAVRIAEEVGPKKLVITHLGSYMEAGLFFAKYHGQEPSTKKLKEKYNALVKIEKELGKKGVELIIAETNLGITSQNELQILE